MPEFYFEPVARLQRYLGKELIAEPNTAIKEFIKNSYDSGAKNVIIVFHIESRSREDQILSISDDGVGMDIESFRENWMRPGYSWKAKQVVTIKVPKDSKSTEDVVERIPVGEKGLGRLAAGRLGDRVHIYTRKRASDPWLHVHVDWTEFDTMDKPLNKIPVKYETTNESEGSGFPIGTTVVIEGLSIDWNGKLPRYRGSSASNYRLGRLREDLGVLLQPISGGERYFSINILSDSKELRRFNGWIKPTELEFLDYEFTTNIEEREGKIYIHRQIRRSKKVANMVGRPEVEESKGFLKNLYHSTELTYFPSHLYCGPFSGVIYYSPESSKRLKEMGLTPGVFIYRDGIRVEPYGQLNNDWLGVVAWKAARQGYAPIQPKNLNGYMNISKINNPGLVDMSNRQGLVDNEEYRAFITISQYEFRWFADLVLFEYVQPQWESTESKAQRAAVGRQLFGVAIIRSMAHSISQSTTGLGAELGNIEIILKNNSIPDQIKQQLTDAVIRSWDHLDNIDQTVQKFLKFDTEDLTAIEAYKEINLTSAIKRVIARVKSLANSKGVEINFIEGSEYTVSFNEATLLSTLENIFNNGIDAAGSTKRLKKYVSISIEKLSPDYYEIVIEDNGRGTGTSSIDELLQKKVATKGRPSSGLLLTREALTLAGGSVYLRQSGSKGSTFVVRLPSKKVT
jgi:signal transduction histidine kinase